MKSYTFRDLLESLKTLSEQQLDQQIKIIPTGYCSDSPVEIDGFSPFQGGISLDIAKGEVIYEEIEDSPMCGSGITGCSDVEEWDTPASVIVGSLREGEQLYSKEDVVLPAGMPYIRISNKEE